MATERLLLVTLLLNLGVIAAIAAVLVRSVGFKRYVYLEHRDLRQKLIFTLFLALPLMGGVWVRLAVPAFQAADLTLPGALLVGLMAGYASGLLGGAIIALPALASGQWLALPLALLAGWAGGLCRHAAPNPDEIWAFSPFIDLELWRWLRNRLDRPFRDWQALVFAVALALTLIQFELHRTWPRRLFAPTPHRAWVLLLILATYILCLAVPIKIWDNTRKELQLEAQQRLLMQARLDALTSQINPHFLFNTLNSVASLVRFDPDTARLLIVKLASLLRRMLRKHENYVALREELQFVDDYLDIEVVRFGPEKLRVEKDIEPAALDLLLPSMLLQPLIENAIRHGLAPKVEGGRVAMRAHRVGAGRDERLILVVEDDGVGVNTPASPAISTGHGIGLANVRERLRVLYADNAELEFSSHEGVGTSVRITLPVLAGAAATGGT